MLSFRRDQGCLCFASAPQLTSPVQKISLVRLASLCLRSIVRCGFASFVRESREGLGWRSWAHYSQISSGASRTLAARSMNPCV